MNISRRSLLSGVAAAAGPLAAQSAPSNIVISSVNGIECCNRAMELLKAGEDTLDAVIAGVNIPELDPEESGVGYGGLPNEDGVVELDACVMHGPSRRAGSVAALQGIKTPSKVAKLVMESSDHIMMVGKGAQRFAVAHGFRKEELLTEKARLAWLAWKESGRNDWGPGLDAPENEKTARRLLESLPGAKREWLPWAFDVARNPILGTINCLALNDKGEMSGCTTTSGLAWKIPGRVGDSPIIGAGLYVDQDVGAAGSTGRGEENIRIAGAHSVVENMRHGMNAEEACLDALRRVSRNYGDDKGRLAKVSIFFYALRNDGDHAAASLWSSNTRGRRRYVVNDGSGSRPVEGAYLHER